MTRLDDSMTTRMSMRQWLHDVLGPSLGLTSPSRDVRYADKVDAYPMLVTSPLAPPGSEAPQKPRTASRRREKNGEEDGKPSWPFPTQKQKAKRKRRLLGIAFRW